LSDARLVCPFFDRLRQLTLSGPGNGAEIVDQVGLRHPDSRVSRREGLVLLVGANLDEQLLRFAEDFGTDNGCCQERQKHLNALMIKLIN
jgi:hypothetical protein